MKVSQGLVCLEKFLAVMKENRLLQIKQLTTTPYYPMCSGLVERFNGTKKTLLRLRERERNVLFNDTLNTFYLRLYGVRHMVKDHSDSEKGNPLLPHRLLLSINSKGSFICTIPQTG